MTQADWSRRLQRAWLKRGPLAITLWPLSQLFALVVRIRRTLYAAGRLPTQELPVPVIVVGNLIVGGAGKTPTAIAIVQLLQRRGYTPGVVSRGYGRREDGVLSVDDDTQATAAGDEPLLIRRRTRAPVAVGRDRAAAAEFLLSLHPEIDVIVCDDGLQHLRLARTAQVLVFDERGTGNGWLLPAGPLREPLPQRTPAATLVLYNATRRTTRLKGEFAKRSLAGIAPLNEWRVGAAPSLPALDALKRAARSPIVAAAGMAQPQRFFAMLRDHGLPIKKCPLPDHHDFRALPWPRDTPDVIVTEKDAVKLDPARLGTATRVWVATLDFMLPAAFEAALLALLPPPTTSTAPSSR
ncbi:MAG TPA: tetraacyldisaccharide 4'-kinase [Burkholderiaceae bacterium]|nr:tetraacyldisaccharide 4'-kinase [Burkholderiaceae bacterium]